MPRTTLPLPDLTKMAILAALAAPLAIASVLGAGCGGPSQPAKTVDAATPSGSDDAGATALSADAPALPEAAVMVADAAKPADAGTDLVTGDVGAAAGDGAAPPCWKGFKPTGNAVADVADLGARCAAGMVQVIPPVKHTFKTGESKSIPIPFMAGCYRIIAVGGTGVKDVDLALKDNAGKIVAADMTPDDIFPMIHPNKELCMDAVQILNLNIIVKKGAGEVAGGVWKR
jgi:hypothetical protein